MEKTTKIALYSLGGLALATGLFFGIRAIIKSTKTEKDNLSSAEKRELENLRNKRNNNSPLTEKEQVRLDELDKVFKPNAGETTQLGGCSFPLRNGDTCKEVAQLQVAINKKHNPSGFLSGGGGNWACLPAYPGQHDNLLVDGQLGPSTAKMLGRFYELCESSGFLYEVCDCQNMKVSESTYNNIISGVDVSDAALSSAGYSSFSGFNNLTGKNMRNLTGVSSSQSTPQPTSPFQNRMNSMNCNGLQSRENVLTNKLEKLQANNSNPQWQRQLKSKLEYIDRQQQQNRCSGYSNFNLPDYGNTYDSPLGDFYKSQFAFTDDYPKQSEMEHSYGMGKGFGFAGSPNYPINGQTEEDWSGGLNSAGEFITEQEFIDEIP